MKHVKTHTARDGQQRLQPACYKHININYEQCSSVNKVQPDLASEIRHGIFGGLNFGPGNFGGFCWEC